MMPSDQALMMKADGSSASLVSVVPVFPGGSRERTNSRQPNGDRHDGIRKAPGGTGHLGDQPVARIGFGAMQLVERLDGRPAVGEEVALAVLRDAVGHGIDHIDTAEFYGEGTANQRIRAALHPYAESLALVTKVGACEPGIPIALRDEGKIGGIGLSAVTAGQLREALPAGIVCVQNGCNLVDRSAQPVLDLCREHDVAWVPFFPLGSSHPRIPKATAYPAVTEVAARIGVTPAQVALAWLLGHYGNTLLTPVRPTPPTWPRTSRPATFTWTRTRWPLSTGPPGDGSAGRQLTALLLAGTPAWQVTVMVTRTLPCLKTAVGDGPGPVSTERTLYGWVGWAERISAVVGAGQFAVTEPP
jgi:diketogulonate reductase-like aldo/keto reductase